jgi:hypothetical protein
VQPDATYPDACRLRSRHNGEQSQDYGEKPDAKHGHDNSSGQLPASNNTLQNILCST